MRADVSRCPVCEADWSSGGRIRRRSRSTRVRPRSLLRSALLGALATILVSTLLNLLVTALARHSVPASAAGISFGARLYYAWCTLSNSVGTLCAWLWGAGSSIILTALAGAVVGTAWYLVGHGVLRRAQHSGHHSSRSGVTRRRRSR